MTPNEPGGRHSPLAPGGRGSGGEGESCPHFQTRIERLPLELTTALLPIRRCLLAERMIGLVRNKPEAEGVVDAFLRDAQSPLPYCICGPDLDTIEHAKCVKSRCAGSCTPAYHEILGGFGVEDLDELSCEEPGAGRCGV